MKKAILISALLFPLAMMAQEKTLSVSVTNNWNKAKSDEPIVLKFTEIKKLSFNVSSATITLNGKDIPCQLDDLNGDTKNDELVFLADIPAKATQTYEVKLCAKGENKNYDSRVYAHMGLNDKYGKYPTINGIEAPGDSYIFKDVYPHGAEFENEFTAWRVYVDERQNIDLYGKKKRQLELEKTHFYSVKEDLDNGFGNDVLWAGASMGCGTLREFKNGSPLLIDNVKLRGQRIASYGPLRTVVEMKDLGWNGNNIYTYYILYAGHREMEVQINADEALKNWQLCTGVQKVGTEPKHFTTSNIAASWGSDYPDYGKKELYKPEAVGLAVYVPEKYADKQVNDTLQYMITLKPSQFAKYYVSFCADMEEEGFHSAEEWFGSLAEWKEELDNAVKVKITSK